MSQTWFITGANSGFGREITQVALRRGDKVVGIVRKVDSLHDLVEIYPDRLFPLQYEITQISHIDALIHKVLHEIGPIDILVNNAGKGLIGAVEEIADEDFRSLMDLHLFAPVALVKAVLPSMRERKSGTIIQMSSQGGRYSFPSIGVYSATKFALEGWSEALAAEVKPFNIAVIIVEPGAFRTAFNHPGVIEFAPALPEYAAITEPVKVALVEVDGVQPGDPARAAKVIYEVVYSEQPPLRLALGSDAVDTIMDSLKESMASIEKWEATSRSADYV